MALSSQRHANPKLAGSSAHSVSHYPVESYRGKQKCQQTEETGQCGEQTFLSQGFVDELCKCLNAKHGEIFVQKLEFLSNRTDQFVRSAGGKNVQGVDVLSGGVLQERQVDDTTRWFPQIDIPRVPHHTDNLQVLPCQFANPNSPADWILISKEVVHKPFIDNRNLGRLTLVGEGEVSAHQKRCAHRPKKHWTNLIDMGTPITIKLFLA